MEMVHLEPLWDQENLKDDSNIYQDGIFSKIIFKKDFRLRNKLIFVWESDTLYLLH